MPDFTYQQITNIVLRVVLALVALNNAFQPLSAQSTAGIYTVQSTVQLVPPYSTSLTDYVQSGSEKLRVILLQRDLSQVDYPVRLFFSIYLNGKLIIRTARGYNPPPFSLSPGVPTILSGSDLAAYFETRNLDFVGYDRALYERTKTLPEGSFQLCATAYYHARPEVQVSNQGCSFYYLAKNEPPLITQPACGSKIPRREPTQLIFQWIPRSTASPNSALSTEYELQLFEVRVPGRNPNDIALSQPPVFRITTEQSLYVYSVADPPLTEGMQYVWRVQARDKEGKDDFRNNGFSEVCSFTYGGSDDPAFQVGVVQNLRAQGTAPQSGRIQWQQQPQDFDSYRVYYKKVGADFGWAQADSKDSLVTVNGLEADSEYETRIQGVKNGVYGAYSEIVSFRTPKPRQVQCGQGVNDATPQADKTKPLLDALSGDLIQVDGQVMQLVEVENLGDGYYRGKGKMIVDLLAGLGFKVTFERLYIDVNKVAGRGRIDYVSRGMEAALAGGGSIIRLDSVFSKLNRLYTSLTADLRENKLKRQDLQAFIRDADRLLADSARYENLAIRQLQTALETLREAERTEMHNTASASNTIMLASDKAVQLSQRIEAVRQKIDDLKSGTSVVAAQKGKLAITIADTIMTEGKIFIYTGVSKQIKLKFHISDTTKTKVAYQLLSIVESTGKPMSYPKTGYDTLVYNQAKEITLDSIPQGKYTLLCKAGQHEYKIRFFIRKKKLEITKAQLKAIFPKTDDKRLEEVVKAVNANSATFGISTTERMAHFIGQIGAETGGLNKLKEDHSYSPRSVAKTFSAPQYGHLFEQVTLDSTKYEYGYNPTNYDENKCNGVLIDRGGTVFSYKNSDAIRNAYAAIKSDTLVVMLNNKTSKIPIYKLRTDVTKDNIQRLVKDGEYNSGIVRVKSKYIRSSALFDVTYGCRMGNGNIASKDGSTFLGKGFIHITGKDGYKAVSLGWNKLYPNDQKEFHGKDITLLETDVEVAIKASMVYWKLKGLNQEADKGTSPEIVEKIGTKVNGGDNGMDLRKSYTKLAAANLK